MSNPILTLTLTLTRNRTQTLTQAQTHTLILMPVEFEGLLKGPNIMQKKLNQPQF